MKKFLAAIVLAGLLTGCGSAKSSEERSSSPKSEVVAAGETSSEAETEKPSETEKTSEEEPSEDVFVYAPTEPETEPSAASSFSFKLTDKGVEATSGFGTTQLIEVDTSELIQFNDPESLLAVKDFDFDGEADLFVPTVLGTPNLPGKYFRYDKDTEKYAEWPEMNEKIGVLCEPMAYAGLLLVYEKISATDNTMTFYNWEDGKLVLNSKDVQALADDGKIYVDSYSYEGGEEERYMRRLVELDEDGDLISFEEVPIED